MRILVADDDATIRDVLAEILTAEGHQVVQASSHHEALGLGRAERWDLFLVDTFGKADHGSSEEYAAFLRALGAHAPVIVCTAPAWALGAAPAGLGVAAILCKPFEITELIEQVAAIGRR